MNPKNKSAKFHSALDRKHDVERELQQLSDEASTAAVDIHHLKTQRAELSGRIRSLAQSVEKARANNREKNESRYLAEVELERKRITNQLQKLEDRSAEISTQRALLRKEVESTSLGVDVDVILAHRESLESARAEIAALTSLINEKEAALESAAPSSDERIDSLQRRREDALAAAVTGETTHDAVDAIDAEIEILIGDSSGAETEQLNRFREINQTLAGLKRKLAKAENTLQDIESLTPDVIHGFLRDQAETIGAEYLKQATILIESFKRLRALNDMIGAAGGTSISKMAWPNMILPGFKLNCFADAILHDPVDVILYSAQHALTNGEFDQQRKIEAQRFGQIGLEEFFK